MNAIPSVTPSQSLSRREALRGLGAVALFAGIPSLRVMAGSGKDSLPMQFYKSLSEEQRSTICLPLNDPKRSYVSNWWYVNPEQRLHTFYTPDQQDLVRQIFESLHHPDHREKMVWQVNKDLMGKISNTPSVGFFGTPEDKEFEFIYTGHHVTRRCNAHTDRGLGFGGNPIFYGNFAKGFNESPLHEGNPFWYQGLLFNEFVKALDGPQQERILVGREPRPEHPSKVILKRKTDLPGLACADLTHDQQAKLLETMRLMLACFRKDDVDATMRSIQERGLIQQLFVSCYGGKYDIGSDRVWDTWQIEGPDFVWYFRGMPHIHSYFHLTA